MQETSTIVGYCRIFVGNELDRDRFGCTFEQREGYRIFAQTQELVKKRSKSNYRGVKNFDNVYSGYLYCGDCGSPMFSMSRADLDPAYICGTYHKRRSAFGNVSQSCAIF